MSAPAATASDSFLTRELTSLYGRAHVWLYRRSRGADRLTRMWEFPVVLLTTRGAASGRLRTAALGGFPDGDDAWLIVATGATGRTRPAWFANMLRHPDDLWLEVGARRVKVQGRVLAEPERTAALRRIASTSPRYGKAQDRSARAIPVVRLSAAV